MMKKMLLKMGLLALKVSIWPKIVVLAVLRVFKFFTKMPILRKLRKKFWQKIEEDALLRIKKAYAKGIKNYQIHDVSLNSPIFTFDTDKILYSKSDKKLFLMEMQQSNLKQMNLNFEVCPKLELVSGSCSMGSKIFVLDFHIAEKINMVNFTEKISNFQFWEFFPKS